jgi:alkylation response protein AidB-like acyl-CoA dehydrogenase
MLLTPEQEMIRDAVRQFAQDVIAPQAARWDRDKTFPKDVHKELARLGAYGVAVPEPWAAPGSTICRSR